MFAITFSQTWWVWLILSAIMFGLAFRNFFKGVYSFGSSWIQDAAEVEEKAVDDWFKADFFKGVKGCLTFALLGALFFILMIISVLFRLFG